MESSDSPRYARLSGLLQAVERLVTATSLEEIVETIRGSARRVIGADGVAVILREGDECHYIEEDAIGPLWKGQRFPMESCISGWAMLNRATAVIADIAADERIPQELYRDTFVRSLVMTPIRTQDPLGAIGAYWSDPHEPSADAVSALETLARTASTSLENIRLIAALSQAVTEADLARDELRHRLGNAFSVAQALASLTLPREQAADLIARLKALSRMRAQIDQKLARNAAISVGDLVRAELEPYRTKDTDRISFAGDRMMLPNEQAATLGLVFNELASNAVRDGALSTPGGKIRVHWYAERHYLVLEWQETGEPGIRPAVMEGFGSRLLRRLVEGQLHGSLTRFLERDGVTCIIEIPGMAGVQTTA